MSILDVFKSKWSAQSMSEDDRRKLFWYLKRASSYTAWKARADAFDRFAEVVERQVRDEPVAMGRWKDPAWATNWENFYTGILKAQVLYEQGLARLRQGDRSVWRYNDRGVLLDALNVHGHWWTALVNHGPHGDIFFEGIHVAEMTAAIDDPSLKATAGVVQSVLAEPMAANFWSKEVMASLDREVPFPPALPDVPVTDKQVTVRSGQPVPCFGIFEPQVQDGCMNYLLEGAPAPTAVRVDEVDGDFIIRPAVWRLVWEDTRYSDGSIPGEEQRYFLVTEVRKPAPSAYIKTDPVISLESNQRASMSGVWAVVNRLDVRQRFEAGDTLPQHQGRDVEWVWVSKA
jgi:hypothetical protein